MERAQRTHTEEFHEVYDGDLEIPVLNQALLAWERTYNTLRSHQALDWRIPMEYLQSRHVGTTQSWPLNCLICSERVQADDSLAVVL